MKKKNPFPMRQIILPQISREGAEILAVVVISAFLLSLLSPFLGSAATGLAIFTYYFFRDPERVPPDDKDACLAPADGRIISIEKSGMPKELDLKGEYTKISIFMSVFDVHVNRNPVSGKVLRMAYVPGKFINASLDKASDDNERAIVLAETAHGDKTAFVQIAGLVARRIVNHLGEGAPITAGERFGLIKFGSRMDVYLPSGRYNIMAKEGQSTIAGETILATLKKGK
jgi:phosphatidylserine decarboxylase